MLTSIALLLLCDTKAGPLDAFRANYAAIRAEIEFTYEAGSVGRDYLPRRDPWAGLPAGFVENRVRRVSGRWGCDGAVEHLVVSPPDDVLEAARKSSKPGELRLEQTPVEILSDGETAAWHVLDPNVATLQVAITDRPFLRAHGPFLWFGPKPFPASVRSEFPDSVPTQNQAQKNGHPVEVSVYRKTIEKDAWEQLEVAYDQDFGYLPRYARIIGVFPDPDGKRIAYVKELYLLDARPCRAGGFVPMEWYAVSFSIKGFETRYPHYDETTALDPTEFPVGVRHFTVAAMKDLSAPACLDRLDALKAIGAIGGVVPLPKGTNTRTLSQVKGMLGQKRLTEHAFQVLPNIDAAELHEFDQKPGRPIGTYLLAGAALCGVALIVYKRRRGRALVMILACFASSSGCGRAVNPVVHLKAAFTTTRLIYQVKEPWLPLVLVLKNEGNIPVRVFGVNTGCSCRRIDTSTLPAELQPGRSLKLPVEVHNSRQYTPQNLPFTFETNHGSIVTLAALLALPDHHLSPESVTLDGDDRDGDLAFELVHRAVWPRGGKKSLAELELPYGFNAVKVRSHAGAVGGAAEFAYEDTTYRVSLHNSDLGLHKAGIDLRDGDHRLLTETPVVWKRVAYLSTTPEQVTLGVRAVRVFLRCPDEGVELTRVISTPDGVKAVLSSPRELTVQLDPAAPAVIEGAILVGTTAEGSATCRVPVVRYSPLTRK